MIFRGHSQVFGHRQSGHSVRRRDQGSEDKTYGQRQSRHGVDQVTSHDHRQENQKNGEGENGPKVCPEISPRSVNGRWVKERREKQIENQFRFEMNLRKTRDQSQSDTPNSEQNGIGHADFPGDNRKQRNSHETNQD